MKKFLLIPLILLSALGLAHAESLNKPAPDFTLKSNQGNNIRLQELKGNVVLVNFWASWCGPCRKEMPELDKLHKKYQRLGFTVLGVNVETDSAAANGLLKDNPVSFPILYDTENRTSELYNVNAMPTTVLVDRDGNMRFIHLAYQAGYEKMYEKQIKQLIRE
ncbi:TlpA family protein disulfide reductase [Dasania sp. GY-MA-18]|uniref:TlpA disulfide reductase family protein n=1 Tax=Dasania phycosphaerae TaxID=2950436 RepID=A0A9J6RJD0_9GAMM|nr:MULTISPECIES: TlpA disulfide reductase family protein [Dasania]MCR8922378.1 TlpA family protein disulfide reductase [Dasania sp. GY-MA-18]MCZ0864806.1 TlpA disulfide reductase family protein [Dasania phycosphaerae]MCZ0868534.1 TlpA disulfide reductase family protein [Dasania phycosphaerae]